MPGQCANSLERHVNNPHGAQHSYTTATRVAESTGTALASVQTTRRPQAAEAGAKVDEPAHRGTDASQKQGDVARGSAPRRRLAVDRVTSTAGQCYGERGHT